VDTSQNRFIIALRSGDIILVEFPSSPHEAIIRGIEQMIGIYNGRISNRHSKPIRSLGSARTKYGHGNVFEADISCTNGFIPPHGFPTDTRGAIIPTFVIEVGFSESLVSLCTTALAYLANEVVRMVVSIKLIGSFQQHHHNVTAMFCLVHEKDAVTNAIRVVHVINFGPPRIFSRSFLQTLSNETQVPVEHFEGVGFDYHGEYPFPTDHPTFVVNVPAVSVLWYGISTEIVENALHIHGPNVQQDFILKLCELSEILMECSYLRI
jgi:hypothetical protein